MASSDADGDRARSVLELVEGETLAERLERDRAAKPGCRWPKR